MIIAYSETDMNIHINDALRNALTVLVPDLYSTANVQRVAVMVIF